MTKRKAEGHWVHRQSLRGKGGGWRRGWEAGGGANLMNYFRSAFFLLDLSTTNFGITILGCPRRTPRIPNNVG